MSPAQRFPGAARSVDGGISFDRARWRSQRSPARRGANCCGELKDCSRMNSSTPGSLASPHQGIHAGILVGAVLLFVIPPQARTIEIVEGRTAVVRGRDLGEFRDRAGVRTTRWAAMRGWGSFEDCFLQVFAARDVTRGKLNGRTGMTVTLALAMRRGISARERTARPGCRSARFLRCHFFVNVALPTADDRWIDWLERTYIKIRQLTLAGDRSDRWASIPGADRRSAGEASARCWRFGR